MSASSSTASSLSRSRAAVLAVATLAAAFGSYYVYRSSAPPDAHPTGLHRSNAVHRRRRRNTATASDDATSLFVDSSENDEDAQVVARQLADGETVVDESAY